MVKKKNTTKVKTEFDVINQAMWNCNPDAEPVFTEPKYRRFEYASNVYENPVDVEKDLNPLGQNGWELIQIDIQHNLETGKTVRVALFKRELL